MTAFYNEIDPFAAHLLRTQIAQGVIAPGVVSEKSIKDLTADDLQGFTQVHLFAGGGLWSAASRSAGWSDDRPLWTASCPCQPFSQAGQGRGVDDPRHLWPDVDRLINEARRRLWNRPPPIVGEQVAGSAGYHWFDGVRTDLARQGYGARVVDFPACAVDAPHIRQRLYWAAIDMADAAVGRRGERQPGSEAARYGHQPAAAHGSNYGAMAHADRSGRAGRQEAQERSTLGRVVTERADDHGAMRDAFLPRLEGQRRDGDGAGRWPVEAGPASSPDGRNGTHWSDAEWITCHDGKARRAQPGVRLLVDGLPRRVDLWRVAGNAIVVPAAREVIAALMDVLDWRDAA